MWYAMQVYTGKETKIIKCCEVLIPGEYLDECFIPYYQRKIKLNGKWQIQNKILFPGYIFMVTEMINELRFELDKISEFTKIVGVGDEVIPLYEHEVEFLKKFGNNDYIVEMSKGIIEGDKVDIIEGPMQGFDGRIKKIDRHKRIAIIEIEFFGRKTDVKVGLEIIEKS